MPSSDGGVQVTDVEAIRDAIDQNSVTVTALEYLRVIHRLEAAHEVAMPTRIAEEIGVSVASASNMCKRLASQGLVHRQPRKGVVLSAQGCGMVEEANYRQRLLLAFMVDRQDIRRDYAVAEAERLSLVSSTWFCQLLHDAVIEPDTSLPGVAT